MREEKVFIYDNEEQFRTIFKNVKREELLIKLWVNIKSNYESQQQLDNLKQENEKLKESNDILLKNNYYEHTRATKYQSAWEELKAEILPEYCNSCQCELLKHDTIQELSKKYGLEE